MLKLTSLFLFVAFFTTVNMPAQTLEKAPPAKQNIAGPQLEKVPPVKQTGTELQKVFSNETKKLKNESASVDAKKMDQLRRQTPKKGLTAKEKTWLILGIVGLAVLIFVVIKYYKKCIRYENNCEPAFNDNCYCEEYEQEEQSRQTLIPNGRRSSQQFSPMPGFTRKFSF